MPLRSDATRCYAACQMETLFRILYVPFVGIPLCLMLMTFGLFLCLTIIGIPVGLVCFALGVRLVVL